MAHRGASAAAAERVMSQNTYCSSDDDDDDDESWQVVRRHDHLLAPVIVFWWSPVFVLCPRFEGLTAATATAIGAFSVGLAVFALQHRRTATYLRTVPPVAKCFVSGLLAGLGLLVMLPSALELKPPSYPATKLLFAFCAAPVALYLIHHVLLEHQHAPGSRASCGPHMIQVKKGKGPATLITSGTLQFGTQAKPLYCVSSGPKPVADSTAAKPGSADNKARRGHECEAAAQFASDTAQAYALLEAGLAKLESSMPKEARETLAGCTSVLLRAIPYALHASIDGAVLATATSLRMLASLALPIALCAVQDVGTLLVALVACRASRRAKLAIASCFGLGFPLGASLVLAAGALSPSSGTSVALMRAFAGGLFLYMAIFELAPPHAQNRRAHLRYALGFVAGLSLVVVSEHVEMALAGHSLVGAITSDPDPSTAAQTAVVTTSGISAASSVAVPSAITSGVTALAVSDRAHMAGARVAAARWLGRLPVEEQDMEQEAEARPTVRGRDRPSYTLLPSFDPITTSH